MGHTYNGPERRKFIRFSKHCSLFFYFKDSKDKKREQTFTKDIGRGGIRFTTSQPIDEGTYLVFEIGVPDIAPRKLFLEGIVVASKEITPRLVYAIRSKFNLLDDESNQLFEMVEKLNLKDRKNYGLH